MMRTYARKLLVIALSLLVLTPALASAAGLTTVVPSDCNGQGGCSSVCDLAQLAQNILNDAIYLAIFASAGLFAWAGFKYLTNIANPGVVSRAKEIFSNVIIGFVIVLASWLVVDIIMRTFVGASLLPWNTIC